MLIKRKNLMATPANSVKKVGTSLVGALALSIAAMAPNAFAGESLMTEKTVTVKINVTELQSEKGTEKVYAKLQQRAKSFCRADRSTLSFLQESMSDCTSDLVEQFVQSADVAELKTYHQSQISTSEPKKFALNTK